MKKIELDLPHVIDNFLRPNSLITLQKLVKSLSKRAQPGHVRTMYDSHILYAPTKKNKVVILNDGLHPEILKEIENNVFKQLKLTSKAGKLSLGNPQFSFYRKNDYYGPHRDVTELGITVLLFPMEKNFTGGELHFHSEKKQKVSYKTNRVIIFPSRLLHEVKLIKDGGTRVSLQFFLQKKVPKKRPVGHKDIIDNRKDLAKKIIRLNKESLFEPEQLLSLRRELFDFKNHTLEGSYRYICQHCLGKQPTRVQSKITVKPTFLLTMSSKLMHLSIQILDNKLFTVIKFEKQIFKFPFELMTWEITHQLKDVLKIGVKPGLGQTVDNRPV